MIETISKQRQLEITRNVLNDLMKHVEYIHDMHKVKLTESVSHCLLWLQNLENLGYARPATFKEPPPEAQKKDYFEFIGISDDERMKLRKHQDYCLKRDY